MDCCTLEMHMLCHTMSRYDPSNMELPLQNGSINHFCLCTLYSPTSSLALFFDSCLLYAERSPFFYLNFVLIGDFNVDISSTLYQFLCDVL